MNQRLFIESKLQEEKTFLRKQRQEPKNPICINTNKVFLTEQEEKEVDDFPITTSNSIQSSPYFDISKQANSHVIPISDFLFENKIRESVKSILCPNFVTDRKSLFSNLFNNTFTNSANIKEYFMIKKGV